MTKAVSSGKANNYDNIDSVVSLKNAIKTTAAQARETSGIPEIDTLLGGGFVKGQTVLLSGSPGIGKSTLALQISAKSNKDAVYISGEETPEQIANRAKRAKIDSAKISLAYETSSTAIAGYLSSNKPQLAVVDSVQTLTTPDHPGVQGSVSHIRNATMELVKIAKNNDCILILIGQVTKAGNIAGPKTLEHMVDTVVYIEGDRNSDLRIGRCKKNRFGQSSVSTVFKMTENGLIGVKDPSSAFLSKDTEPLVGTAKTVTTEGQLPLAIEIQALTSPSPFSLPKRVSHGIDRNKLYILLGAIAKYTPVGLAQDDVYINVPGGITAKEPGIDLSIVAAILSSAKKIPLRSDSFFLGEVELSGKIRDTADIKSRLDISRKCGAKRIFLNSNVSGNDIVKIPTVSFLAKALRKG